MRDPFANYDNWLERPYQDMIAESDAFNDWCELHAIDPDDPDAETLYIDYIESQNSQPDEDYERYEDNEY